MTIQRDADLNYENARFDIQFENGDLKLDDSVSAALSVALFTDAQISEAEALPGQDRRGWDILPIGSKLWNRLRGRRGTELLREIEQNVYEATRDLIRRQIILDITASAAFSNTQGDAIILTIRAVRPDESSLVFRTRVGGTI